MEFINLKKQYELLRPNLSVRVDEIWPALISSEAQKWASSRRG